jgi:YVTN family beta-propeller protein
MISFGARLLLALMALVCTAGVAQPAVMAVLPNGREIRPAGDWIPLAPYPFAMALRSDGAQAAIPSIGFPFALNVVDGLVSGHPAVLRMPSGTKNDPEMEVHAGLAYSPDGKLLYVATGDSGNVRAYRTVDWTAEREVSLDGETGGHKFEGSFAAALIISSDGRTLYALDQGNWRVVILDAATLTRIASVPTGRYPFGLALSPDDKRLYVTNTGLFEYKTIPGTHGGDPPSGGLRFPPFGFPSQAAREGANVEARQVPGLGDENSLDGSSLWTYDVSDRERPGVTARLRVGSAIDDRIVGGSAPAGVAATDDAAYVSLAHDDAVVKVTPDGTSVLAETDLSPFAGPQFEHRQNRTLRGVMPSGLAVRDGRVYVAEAGINAVAVLDAASMRVIEHIPVGWNPDAVALSPDGKTLYVVNTKGKGTGPNGGDKHDPGMPTYVGSLELGSLSVIRLAELPAAEELTQTVIAANTADLAGRSPLPRLKHCFLVIRENRTFDEVLGDLPGVNGDASLARYGMDGWAQEDGSAAHLRVTPNLHALARKFAISDNYYVDSDVSADGHRWVAGIQPTPFFDTAWTSNYGGRRREDSFAAQPGRRALFGGADAPMPEDEPEFGSLWEHVARGAGGILNYGEGLELEGSDEDAGLDPEGQRLYLNAPLPLPVFESSDRRFPTFNLGIPDQVRVGEFERDIRQRLATGKIPALVVIRLPNDHTADPRPEDGYPYRASYVADNDLALGRIVQFLSRTSVWKDSALFVTEDDAQGGVDHVDAHRSILLVASPWVKPGTVVHTHSSMGSITRTIDGLLGLGPLNLQDALAGDLSGMFDTAPHMDTFVAVAADAKVFRPAKARTAHPKTKKEAAALRDVDDAEAIREQIEKSAGELRRRSAN